MLSPESERIAELLRARLDPLEAFQPAAPAQRSDFDLNPEWNDARPSAWVEAAVLVPLIERPEGLSVLLTRRADTLNRHAGQVAFPGGRLEAGETPWAAALREAQEEIDLDPAFVEVAGLSSSYRTGTGFHVTPVVGFLKPGFTVSAQEAEVAEVFEIPFAALMDAANHEQRHWDSPTGQRRFFYAIAHGERTVWGATAGMVRALWERLYEEAA